MLSIPITSITEGDRGRIDYGDIEPLKQSIRDHGLLQPIVLQPVDDKTYRLIAGGRRFRALQELGYTMLYHGVSGDPDRPGFLLKHEMPELSKELDLQIAELAENLCRKDLDWREELEMLVKAYRRAKREAALKGEKMLMTTFASMVGCNYHDLKAAEAVYDHFKENPALYANCTSIRGAFSQKLRLEAVEVAKKAGDRIKGYVAPTVVVMQKDEVVVREQERVKVKLNLHLGDGIEWMNSLPAGSINLILTDPDYGVNPELMGFVQDVAEGVVQETVEQSLADLHRFIEAAWRLLPDDGWLVLWYDLDHHEKLQRKLLDVGFKPQRWPLIWHKTNFQSNQAPQFNFCKDIEYACIARKGNATLNFTQTTSVFRCPPLANKSVFSHPFAKPLQVWTWILSAIATSGETMLDPFAGCGTSVCAAIRYGLVPYAAEVQAQHFGTLKLNVMDTYRDLFKGNVEFV